MVRGPRACGTRAWLPYGMWDLSSLARVRTCTLNVGRLIVNNWTTKEVPDSVDLVLELRPSRLWGPHMLLASHFPP